MKSNQTNKTLKSKTGKDILGLLSKKAEKSAKLNIQAPEGDIQISLYGFWKSLLGNENFGVNDDFFQSGGNSLKAIQLLSRISSHFLIQLETTDVFLNPTILQLANLIQSKQNGHPGKLPLVLIEKQERPAILPLSYAQERLYFIDQLEGSVQYHIPAVIRLNGNLNKDALAFAFQQIVNRHEVLRTIYLNDEKKDLTYQRINDKDKWQLGFLDGSVYKNDASGLQKYIQQLINVPFDLSKDCMLRAELISLDENENVLVFTMHHIASDGWSISVLVNEMVEFYSSNAESRDVKLPELQIQYSDYAVWQRKHLSGEFLEKKLTYWKDNLAGLTALQMPVDFSRPAELGNNGAVTEFKIDKDISDNLNSLSQKNGATLFMTLLSAFNVLLYRYSSQNDICIGTPTAGRQQQELENLIGFFVNTLALRNEVNDNESFVDLLQKVKTNTLKAFENQEVPFEKVVDAVVKERDMSRSPLFQVMFILQNTPDADEINMHDISISREETINETAKFELTFSFTETPEGIDGSVEYNTDLYRQETVSGMIGHFKELIKSIIKTPEQSIGDLPMMTFEEENKILKEFNENLISFPKDKTLVDKFEEQAAKAPDNVALIFEDQNISYKELNERSNQLARYLQSKGVKAETLVPICIERSIEMLVGIFGILKAGGAYVPIDPDYPEERKKFMLEDTNAKIIVSNQQNISKLPDSGKINFVLLDEDSEKINKESKENLNQIIQPENLAYIIYTSGSTGKPKGVMIEHRTVVNLINAQSKYFNVTVDENILQFSNYSFDASVEQIFLALFNGASLVLFPDGLQLNIDLFEKFLLDKKVTHLHATPSFLENINPVNLISDGSYFLKRVIAGGDVCKKELAATWRR
jgi:non-ribosomal peptide synthetase component F/acyl carrier protein